MPVASGAEQTLDSLGGVLQGGLCKARAAAAARYLCKAAAWWQGPGAAMDLLVATQDVSCSLFRVIHNGWAWPPASPGRHPRGATLVTSP